MTDKTGGSGFLPTVIFAGTGAFTSSMRTAQLAAEGITGFYEADFADGITSIANNCFQNDTNVVVVTINKVISIGNSAFSGCSNLRSITLDTETDPNTGIYLLTSIGSFAFQYCTSLRNIYIPDSITAGWIGYYWFHNCTSLEVCVIGAGYGTYYINSGMCQNCTSLKYIVIPENIGQIGYDSFSNCTSLTTVVFNGKPIIDSSTFSGAKGSGATYVYDTSWSSTYVGYLPSAASKIAYTSVTFTPTANNTLTPSDVNTQYNAARAGDSYLNTNLYYKAVISSGTTTINSYAWRAYETNNAFASTYYVAISIPTSVTTIGAGAFSTWSGGTFYSNNIYSIYFPRSITTFILEASGDSQLFNLSDWMTRDASKMLQIVFPSGMNFTSLNGSTQYPSTFGGATFKDSPAKAIILPPNTKILSVNCMYECSRVELFNLFQKNAKSNLEEIGSWGCYGVGYWITNKYIYIPKTLHSLSDRSLSTLENNPGSPTTRLYMYSHVDGTQANTNNLWKYIQPYNDTNTNNSIFQSGMWNIIANYYPNGGIGLTSQPYNGGCHMLHVKQVTTIPTSAYQNCIYYASMAFDHYGGPNVKLGNNVFQGANSIKKVYFNGRVIDMGTDTFNGCSALTSMIISNAIPKIPNRTFVNCTSLTELTFETNSSIKYIDPYSIAGCSNLTTITIPKSVISIGYAVFTTNSAAVPNPGLQSVNFEGGSRLSSLMSYVWGSDETTYGPFLTKLILPNNVSYMGINLLRNGRSRLNIFIIPSKTDYIPHAMFYQGGWPYYNITKLYFPISINANAGPRKRIDNTDNGMDTYCIPAPDAACTAYMPSHMSTLFNNTANNYRFNSYTNGSTSYAYTASYYSIETITSGSSIVLNGSVANVTNDSTTTQRHIEFSGNPTIITGYSSGNKSNLISINFPITATSISNNAFQSFTELVYVTFSDGDNFESIGDYTFDGCSMIHEITLPTSLKSIGNYAFRNCSRMERLEIPYNVTSIGTQAFYGCTNLKNVTVYNSNWASTNYFNSSPNFLIETTLYLTNTLHPTSLTISQINNLYIYKRQTQLGIPTITFSANGELTQSAVNTTLANNSVITNDIFHVEFSSGVTSIGNNAFKDIPNVFSVAISANITSIGSYAFNSVNSVLRYLSFHPDSVCNRIYQNAFYENYLYDLTLPDSLVRIDSNAFANSKILISVCIPSGVTTLESNVFTTCPNLYNVKLPSSLSSLNTSTYFSRTAGTNLNPLPTTYNTPSIPHFKLTDYSMPIGNIQNLFDSQLTYIDHLAYAYYTDISVYAEPKQQMKSAGSFNYQINNTLMPCSPSVFLHNVSSSGYPSQFPLYRSVPDYVYLLTSIGSTGTEGSLANRDDYYTVMPGFSIAIYSDLYEEYNILAADSSAATASSSYTYFDNEYGKKPAQIQMNPANQNESIIIAHAGKMVSKIYL